jgi:hypothetical protein
MAPRSRTRYSPGITPPAILLLFGHETLIPNTTGSLLTIQGYALIEYAQKEEAEKAIKETSGTTFLEKTIHA